MYRGAESVVSFMFTDVESSSTLWERNGDAMAQALERHDRIVASVVDEHRGRVVKHLGDGVYIVFNQPGDAVECAVALMEALQAEPFDELDGPLRVRMGVHTGTALERDGDYFGRAVNRAARVSDTANGDQIVISEATRQLCPDLAFEDHGTHELKGVGVEHLYLLRDRRLRIDTRPLRVSKQSNLPTDTSAFVGRADELAGLSERLAAGEGLSLVGPGGVGKTRLALQLASHIQHRYPDGTWFCQLDSVAAGDSVGPAVAETIGASPVPNQPYAQSIGRHLERRTALIILDNCEHVLDQAREVVDAITNLAPACSVVATSRAALGRPGERIHQVTPLDESTGVELMVSRIRERDPDYELSDDEHRAAVDICRRLDGLPLAIELAAARLALLPLQEIGGLLADRFRLLSDRSSAGRHATLLQTIQWSHDLLTPDEQRLFAELSVFRGGFTLESVAAVTSAGDLYEALDLITGLVDKSMVVARSGLGSERLSLLESLREFGAQQLADGGQTVACRERHGHWFGRIAEEQAALLFTRSEAKAWPVLEQEWDNLRAAFHNALDRDDLTTAAGIIESIHYFAVLAMRFEGLNWAHTWLAHPGAAGHERLRAVQAIAASASYYAMDLPEAVASTEAAMDDGSRFDSMPFVAIWA
ncbi:MAG: adenylate/guanylate cyclase domain-containing protein, partial [Actinomycetota bacterium]